MVRSPSGNPGTNVRRRCHGTHDAASAIERAQMADRGVRNQLLHVGLLETEEPFLELGLERPADGAKLTSASTFNSMIRSEWLKLHPDIRFQPTLGVIGGEDMVFYRAAHGAGLRIYYSERACVYENEPLSRANLAYQLRLFLWHGNSTYVACVRSGVPVSRMLLHGATSLARALLRPIVRVSRGQRPQLRYCLAAVLHAVGNMLGPLGIRVDHR